MPKNTFTGLLIAYGAGLTGGLLSLLFASILLRDNFTYDPEEFICTDRDFSIIVGLILDFIFPFFVGIAFLLPLAAAEKKKIEELSFIELMKRYAPLISIPLGLLFSFPLFSIFRCESDQYFMTVILLNCFGIVFSSLWFFIRRLKS